MTRFEHKRLIAASLLGPLLAPHVGIEESDTLQRYREVLYRKAMDEAERFLTWTEGLSWRDREG